MGSRAGSTLFYGVYWDENEYVFKGEENPKNEDIDPDEFDEVVVKDFPSLSFQGIYSYETSYCLCIKDSFFEGDWDSPTIIDIDKLSSTKKDLADALLKAACEKLGLNYVKPKLQMLSTYW